jgi:superfamily II DNA or RNA helicase
LIFIGDECHHHSSEGYVEKMLPSSKFRIGLSATPFHYLDEERNDRLRAIYDRSVFTYTLADAVRDRVLTPYEYHPIPVELTLSESAEYLELSDQIARLFVQSKGSKDKQANQRLTSLLMRRSRLIGSATNKLPALNNLLEEQKRIDPYSLFYCGDGRTQIESDELDDDPDVADDLSVKQRHAVSQLLATRGVRVSPFTSEENRSQRREILRRFKEGQTEALVAIRCLDEGIDVPACRTAYLLASSRNPRQFVQRRGRILRKSEGKEYAKIYDFVVVLPEEYVSSSQDSSDFLKNELGRVADFAQNSLYPTTSIQPLMPWLRRYRLEHLAV